VGALVTKRILVELDDPAAANGPATVYDVDVDVDVSAEIQLQKVAKLTPRLVLWTVDASAPTSVGDRVVRTSEGVFNASAQVRTNLAAAALAATDPHGYDARRAELRRRAEAVGAKLAGQDEDEGVIDATGTWHEPITLVAWPAIAAGLDAIEKIVEVLEGLRRPATGRYDEEIRRLHIAMGRTEAKIEEMHDAVAGCPCCPTCGAIARFGAVYLDLTRKQERQLAWLTILRVKAGELPEADLRQAAADFALLSKKR
jgi:hypothetical protein